MWLTSSSVFVPLLWELCCTEYTGGTVEGLKWLCLLVLLYNFERNDTCFYATPESWVLEFYLCPRLSFLLGKLPPCWTWYLYMSILIHKFWSQWSIFGKERPGEKQSSSLENEVRGIKCLLIPSRAFYHIFIVVILTFIFLS